MGSTWGTNKAPGFESFGLTSRKCNPFLRGLSLLWPLFLTRLEKTTTTSITSKSFPSPHLTAELSWSSNCIASTPSTSFSCARFPLLIILRHVRLFVSFPPPNIQLLLYSNMEEVRKCVLALCDCVLAAKRPYTVWWISNTERDVHRVLLDFLFGVFIHCNKYWYESVAGEALLRSETLSQ